MDSVVGHASPLSRCESRGSGASGMHVRRLVLGTRLGLRDVHAFACLLTTRAPNVGGIHSSSTLEEALNPASGHPHRLVSPPDEVVRTEKAEVGSSAEIYRGHRPVDLTPVDVEPSRAASRLLVKGRVWL